MREALIRVRDFFTRHQHPAAHWLAELLRQYESGDPAFWEAVNSTRFWGGAGSIACEALGDNPGIPEVAWQAELQAFRADLIEIAQEIQARGSAHPDIQSWLLAYHNWNRAGV
jgi:hypothetical protein